MTSLPPAAAGLPGEADSGRGKATTPEAAEPDEHQLAGTTGAVQPAVATSHTAATGHNGGGRRPGPGVGSGAVWEPRVPPVRPSAAAVELTLDLRDTPPDKALSRLLGALERVSDDVTLVALVRDTPEFVGVVSSMYQALRQRGYWSDSSRFPAGVQRLRIGRRAPRRGRRDANGFDADHRHEPAYVPPPPRTISDEVMEQRVEKGDVAPFPTSFQGEVSGAAGRAGA
jgi:hypothetical protein